MSLNDPFSQEHASAAEAAVPESSADAGKPAAFCQNCGKALDQAAVRVVGPAVYCEPCLAARLSGAPLGPRPRSQGGGSAAPGNTGWQWGAGMPSSWASTSTPNPGLAALLGFIPGVGAMYNEQYAKGILHLLIFAVLISLSHSSDVFGFFAFGWICYMVIEAHHTARARRDGTPLPNPFGFNELSERLGFGMVSPSAPPVAGAPSASAWAEGAGFTRTAGLPPVGGTSSFSSVPGGESVPRPPASAAGYVSVGTSWGAPAETFGAAGEGQAGQTGSASSGNYAPYFAPYSPHQTPPVPPYGPPTAPPYAAVPDPSVVSRPNRFPVGAIWLIGLGTILLLSTTGIFHLVFGWSLIGFVLIGLAVWIFLRRMLDPEAGPGGGLSDFGAPGYALRILRALRVSVWVLSIGVLLLLDEFNVASWQRSWPLFLILAGVMALLQRAAYTSAAIADAHPFTPPGVSPWPSGESPSGGFAQAPFGAAVNGPGTSPIPNYAHVAGEHPAAPSTHEGEV